tara:strand:- start:64 stop:252 length:189 start_codon:yes stop_codon:yes gene_type:complete
VQIKNEHVNKYIVWIISIVLSQIINKIEIFNPKIQPLKVVNLVNAPKINKDKIGAQNNDIKL